MSLYILMAAYASYRKAFRKFMVGTAEPKRRERLVILYARWVWLTKSSSGAQWYGP